MSEPGRERDIDRENIDRERDIDREQGDGGDARRELLRSLAAPDSHALLLDVFPLPIWRSGTDAECDYFNRAWLEFTGRSMEQELGTAWAHGVHPEDLEHCMSTYLRAFAAREPFELCYRLRRHDGTFRRVIDFGRPYENAAGEFAGYIGALVDDTEHREKEQQLFQAQKMEAVGRLASGIAHDFSNILVAITGYASMLLDDIPEWDGRHNYVAQIERAADRATALIRQLLVFSSEHVSEPRPLDLNGVIRGIHRILTRVLGENIEIEMHLEADLPAIAASPGLMEQVIVNLAVNSLDAMPKGGRLGITTTRSVLQDDNAHDLDAGAYVQLSVSDDGCGMSEDVRDRAFEPFFAGAVGGRSPGTGLGLATVFGIVQQSGGRVAIESAVDEGTTVRLFFPVTEEPAPAEDAESLQESPRGTETVLVVEDDDAVNQLMVRVLEDNGYRVLVASDGDSALEVSARHDDAIDLMITDVVMPRMSGGELAGRINEQRPGTRILFVSGYTERAREHLPKDLGIAFLPKPFRPIELAQRVRDILEARSNGS